MSKAKKSSNQEKRLR